VWQNGAMRHCIHLGVFGDHPFVDISSEDFELIKRAKDNVFVLLDIEVKFDIVIANYLEYERDLLDLALSYMARHRATWFSFQDAKMLINRRLANLLTASRLYTDQLRHDLACIFGGDAELPTQVERALSEQYDGRLGYRLMEKIRNFIQHKSLPITHLSYPTSRKERDSLLHHCVVAGVTLSDLREQGFNRAILAELEAVNKDAIDITPFTRQYVEGLGHVHEVVRRGTGVELAAWKATTLETLQRYQDVCPSTTVKRVVAYRLDDQDKTVDEVSVFTEGVERLEEFRRSMLPTHISNWYVSNLSGDGS
jgi:hypothetical protein